MLDPIKLQNLIENSGLSFKQNGRSWIFSCPRCQKREKVYVRKTDGLFVCFHCRETEGFRGRPEFVLSELLGRSISDIQKVLYGDEFADKSYSELMQVPLLSYFGDDDEVVEDVVDTLPSVGWPLDFYPIDHKHSARGARYLEGRGIPVAVATGYGIRYCPPTRRVIFPVEARGRLLGWQARSIIPTEMEGDDGIIHTTPKILTTTGLRKDLVLMFQDCLRGSEHAIVCEGPVDAIKTGLCGGGVATMGKAVSDSQLRAIKKSGVRKVYLALDPDAAQEMDRVCKELAGLEMYNLQPAPGFKDLGEMDMEGVRQRFLSAPRIDSGQLFIYLRY